MHADPLPLELTATLERERIKAMLAGQEDWGVYGDADHHERFLVPSNTRRLCRCGCLTRSTHLGFANGIVLIAGCEFRVRQWVRNR